MVVTVILDKVAGFMVTLNVVVLVTLPSVYETVTVFVPALVELNPLYVHDDVTFFVELSLYVAVTTMPLVFKLSFILYVVLVGIVVTAMLDKVAGFTVTLNVVVRVTLLSVYETVTDFVPALVELNPLYVHEEVTFFVELSLYVAVTVMPLVLRLSFIL